MPRTKRPVRQQENKSERDDALKMLDTIVNEQKKKLDSRAQMECRDIEVAFKILLASIPKAYLEKTIGQLKIEINIKDCPSTVTKSSSSRPVSQDDGYQTENSQSSTSSNKWNKFACPTTQSRPTSRRSRSADTRKHCSSVMKTAPRSRSRSIYKTPMCNKNLNALPAITPKVCPETPLTLLRQPRMGEMVFSTTGSPVMVPTYSTMQQDEKANCNIMLQDGTMLSLQPKELRKSQAFIPYSLMNSNVLSQLKTLRANLDTIVKQGEKVDK